MPDSSAKPVKIDGFLKIDDIPGPSERDGHEEEIECHGMKFNMVAPHDPNSLSRRGRVSLGMFRVWKYYDMSSPYLQNAVFQNKNLGDVIFSARRTIDGETADYLQVTLTETTVVDYDVEPSDDDPDLLEEEIGFAYKTIKFSYEDGKHEVEMDVHVGK